MAEATKIALATPGVEQVVAISGVSVLDNSATLANAGVAYVILKDWSVREKADGQDLRSILLHHAGRTRQDARCGRRWCWSRRRSRASAMPAASP